MDAHCLVLTALDRARRQGMAVPALEVYPSASRLGGLGQAVRLPLGVHQLTGRRYPLLDADGRPLAGTLPAELEAAVRLVLDQPAIPVEAVRRSPGDWPTGASSLAAAGDGPPRVLEHAGGGTYSPVIRWVDAHVSPLDLLAELAPDCELRPVGQGALGWCPFHDDRAPAADGRPGTPSFYVVRNARYGWSWRCLSTNCAHGDGPMRHSFRLFQELLHLEAGEAIRAATQRWPELHPR